MADKIRRDERVCVIERTNLRYLSELPQKVDLVTLDLSFISILLVSFQIVVENVVFLCFKEYFDWLLSIHPFEVLSGCVVMTLFFSFLFSPINSFFDLKRRFELVSTSSGVVPNQLSYPLG